jgi:hypothetical protein
VSSSARWATIWAVRSWSRATRPFSRATRSSSERPVREARISFCMPARSMGLGQAFEQAAGGRWWREVRAGLSRKRSQPHKRAHGVAWTSEIPSTTTLWSARATSWRVAADISTGRRIFCVLRDCTSFRNIRALDRHEPPIPCALRPDMGESRLEGRALAGCRFTPRDHTHRSKQAYDYISVFIRERSRKSACRATR